MLVAAWMEKHQYGQLILVGSSHSRVVFDGFESHYPFQCLLEGTLTKDRVSTRFVCITPVRVADKIYLLQRFVMLSQQGDEALFHSAFEQHSSMS